MATRSLRVPYRRLADDFVRAARENRWRNLGSLIDRNFEEIQRRVDVATGALTPGWSSFTPALSATTTSPTLGTGSTAEGEYRSDGSLITVRFRFVFGSSMARGTGAYRISLPVSAHPNWIHPDAVVVGGVRILDSSTGIPYFAPARLVSSSLLGLDVPGTGSVTSGSPITWASGDSIHGVVQYRPAA